MAEEAPAAAAPAKAAKKKASKAKRSGPSISELILQAVSESKERNGVSLAALKKALAAGGYDVDKNKARVKIAVRGLVSKGTLVQTKGTGLGLVQDEQEGGRAQSQEARGGGREGGSQSQQESGRGQEAQSGRSSSQEAQGGRQEVPEEGEEGSGGGG
uniref:Zgc:110425 n=1 Tax=Tetraodon nigroviridis TaxID=99883 RepID=H3C174_TETNG